MAELTIGEAIHQALDLELSRDDAVILIGHDIARTGGRFAVTRGLLERYGAQRVVDAPLALSGLVGSAVGMSRAGLRPVVELSPLLVSRALGQLLEAEQLPGPLILRLPYGEQLQSAQAVAQLDGIFVAGRSLNIVAPSTPGTAFALTCAAIRGSRPTIVLEPTQLYRGEKEHVGDELVSPFAAPCARYLARGDSLTTLCWGAAIPAARRAVEYVRTRLSAEVELIDLLWLAPLDIAEILTSVRRTGRCVLVQPTAGVGVSNEIIARLNDGALDRLEAPVVRVEVSAGAAQGRVGERFSPQAEKIVAAIEQTLRY